MRSLLARVPVTKLSNVYSSTNVTTAAWVQLSAALPAAVVAMHAYDGSGKVLKLGIGSAGNEVDLNVLISPDSGKILMPVEISKGVRLSIRAVDANATTGTLALTLFG
jgi:hypothetical protein